MATNTTSTLSNNVLTARDKAFELGLEPRQIFSQLAQSKEWDQQSDPQKGGSVNFAIYGLLNPNTSTLSETDDPEGQAMSNTLKPVTLVEKGDVVTTTEKLRLESVDNLDTTGLFLVGQNSGESTDLYAREVMDAQVGADYITIVGQTTKAALTTSNSYTASVAETVAGKLAGYNVPVDPRFNSYVAIAHPNVIADLKAESGEHSWQMVSKYADPASALRNEIGTFAGFRWISSTNVKVEVAGGAAAQTATTLSADKAIGTAVLSLTAATGIVVGDWIKVTHAASSNWYAFKVLAVNSNDVTVGPARYKNGSVYRTKNAGLVEAGVTGDAVVEGAIVYTTYHAGFQAFGYGYAKRPELRITGPFDKLGRLMNVGWYALHGFGELRPEALHKVYSSSARALVM